MASTRKPLTSAYTVTRSPDVKPCMNVVRGSEEYDDWEKAEAITPCGTTSFDFAAGDSMGKVRANNVTVAPEAYAEFHHLGASLEIFMRHDSVRINLSVPTNHIYQQIDLPLPRKPRRKPAKPKGAKGVPVTYCNKPTPDGPCDKAPGHPGACQGV
jgi:hypothetical protein